MGEHQVSALDVTEFTKRVTELVYVSALDVTEFTKRVTELVYAHIPCRSMIEDADPCDPTDTFTLLGGAAAAWPVAARAQERERVSRVARVGILNHGAAGYVRVNEFRNALSELGYVARAET